MALSHLPLAVCNAPESIDTQLPAGEGITRHQAVRERQGPRPHRRRVRRVRRRPPEEDCSRHSPPSRSPWTSPSPPDVAPPTPARSSRASCQHCGHTAQVHELLDTTSRSWPPTEVRYGVPPRGSRWSEERVLLCVDPVGCGRGDAGRGDATVRLVRWSGQGRGRTGSSQLTCWCTWRHHRKPSTLNPSRRSERRGCRAALAEGAGRRVPGRRRSGHRLAAGAMPPGEGRAQLRAARISRSTCSASGRRPGCSVTLMFRPGPASGSMRSPRSRRTGSSVHAAGAGAPGRCLRKAHAAGGGGFGGRVSLPQARLRSCFPLVALPSSVASSFSVALPTPG